VPAPAPLVLEEPTGIDVQPDGSLLVVEFDRRRLLRVVPSTGRVTQIATFVKPWGVARAPTGSTYVSTQNLVQRVDPGHAPVTVASFDPALEIGPVAVTPGGDLIYATVSTLYRLPGGKPGTPQRLAAGTVLPGSHGLTVASDGALLVSDTNDNRILRIEGDKVTTFATLGGPRGIDVAPDGTVYVASGDEHRIVHYSASGDRLGFVGPRFADTYALSVSADGTVDAVDLGGRDGIGRGRRLDASRAEDAVPQLVASDGETAVDDRVLAERARLHVGHDGRDLRQLGADLVREARRAADPAAEDDQLWIDDGHDRDERVRDHRGLGGNHLACAWVARGGRSEDAARAARPRARLPRGSDDGGGGGRGFERSAAEREECDLARRTVCAAVELPIEDEPHPDPGADGDEGEGRDVAAVAVVALGDRGGIDVVLDRRLVPEQAPQLAQHRRPLPSWQVGRQSERAPVRLDHARAADDGVEQRSVALHGGIPEKLSRKRGKLAHSRDSARRAGGPALTEANTAPQVGDRAPDELPAHIEAEHEAGVLPDLVQRRGASPAPRPAARVLHQFVPLEAGERQADGRLRETGGARELAARHRTVAAHPLEQQLLVERPHQPRPCRPSPRRRGHQLVTEIKIG
jgi:hypothetical protein